MTLSTAAFIEGVVEAAPSLRQVFDDHREFYGEYMSPYLFMADVTRWVLQAADRLRFPAEAQSLLDFFEVSLVPLQPVRRGFPVVLEIAPSDLLWHEFFPDLEGWRGRRVVRHLGPNGKREWRAFHPRRWLRRV